MKNIDYKLIDINKWEETLQQIKDKRIVIFGAGNNGRVLLDLLPYKVSYFIDNDKEKWDKKLNDIPIKNPKILKNEKENVSVLVVGYLYDDMIKQLSEFNLEKNIHVYNVYIILEHVLNKISFFNRGEDLINFFKKASDNILANNILNKEKISILVSNFCFSSSPFYLMTIAIMLKLRGNNVEIIWDDLEGLDELYYNCDNITNTQNQVIGTILNYINQRFNITVIKVSEMDIEDLNDDDILELKKLSNVNTISKYRKVFFDDKCEEYYKKCYIILRYNLKKVKSLFRKHKIEKIISFTGMHKKTGLYTWAAKKSNIRVLSYDMSDFGMMITTDGVVTHQKHIEKIIMKNKLDDNLSNLLMNFGERNFNKRLMSSNDIDSCMCQKVNYDEKNNNYKYDVIIPLNIFWDGAALGFDSIFDSIGEWLIETINYILENTDAKIAVRQHPAERFFDSGEDIKSELKDRFGDNTRFTYISSDDEINTYNLIKSAKLVLPHTSTIGIESALLNKPIIMATSVYYSNMSFAENAKSREEYFIFIKDVLNGKIQGLRDLSLNQAKICYALVMLNHIETKFNDLNMNSWVYESFENLLENKNINKILRIFESGDPIDIYKIEDKFMN